MSEAKRGRTARVASYFGRRIGNTFITKVGRDALTGSASEAKAALRIDRVSRDEARGALWGRYEDGGRARFGDMAHERGLTESDLQTLEQMRLRQFHMLALIAAFALLAGGAIPFFTSDWLITFSGLVFGMFSLIFLMIGLRHDFAAWQIRQRRFGGIREYINDRWGR